LPGIIVVLENRGLNPHIDYVARRFALADFKWPLRPMALPSFRRLPRRRLQGRPDVPKGRCKKWPRIMIAARCGLSRASDCSKIGVTRFLLRRPHLHLLVRLSELIWRRRRPLRLPRSEGRDPEYHGQRFWSITGLDKRLARDVPPTNGCNRRQWTHELHLSWLCPRLPFRCDAWRYNSRRRILLPRTVDWFNNNHGVIYCLRPRLGHASRGRSLHAGLRFAPNPASTCGTYAARYHPTAHLLCDLVFSPGTGLVPFKRSSPDRFGMATTNELL